MIFVIDSTDIDRLGTASEELAAMLNEDELKDAALLVFANKQDQPGAKGAGEISEALKLGELRDRNWSIVACSAVDGSGVDEGMDWLVVRSGLRIEDAYMLTRDSKRSNRIHKESWEYQLVISPRWHLGILEYTTYTNDWRIAGSSGCCCIRGLACMAR